MTNPLTSLLPMVICSLAAWPTPGLYAGTAGLAEGKATVAAPEAGPSPLWEVTVRPYGWLAGLEGTTGIRGYTAETDLDFATILENLDMTAALQLEVRHDRWLLLLDGMYLKMSAEGGTPGPLLSGVNLEMEQILAEASVGYRLWESPRGYFDVFAGVRYMHLAGEIGFQVDAAGVRSFSEEVSEEAVNRVAQAVSGAVRGAAPGVKARGQSKAAAIAGEVQNRVEARLGQVLANHPHLPRAIDFIQGSNGPVSSAIRELVAARLAEQAELVETTAQGVRQEVSAAKARVREKVRRAVARAEKKLAQRIETAITDAIPSRVSGSQDWLDPLIGFRGRWNLTETFYAVGRADIGGFGVGSDLSWQAYAGLGWQASPRVSVELGYRYLQMDYHHAGFTYDTATSGVFTALSFTF